MPILVKDYTWQETEKHIFIRIPSKGVKSQKVDVVSTEKYVKINYPPFFFECFLFAEVYDEDSTVEIGNGIILFKLEKKEHNEWGQLQHPDSGDKIKAQEMREVSVQRLHERTQEKEAELKKKKRELSQYALKEQMRLEEDERTRIEQEKEAERRIANDELEKWKEQQKLIAVKEREKLLGEDSPDIFQVYEESSTKNISTSYCKVSSNKNKHKKASEIFHESAEGKPVRDPGKIEVTFTPRTFPTAARESTAPAEEEWLKKQAEARKVIEIENEDLTDEEKSPEWMKEKASKFFKAGDYQSAVNVYSHAIRLNPKMFSLYSNRAACHLKLRNFFKAIEDSSKALEMLTPPVPQNAINRCKAHVRRGTALCELEMYTEGLMDYDAAFKINSSNEQLKHDIERIKEIVQGSKPS